MKICSICKAWMNGENICDDCETARKKVLTDYIKQLELAKSHNQKLFDTMLHNGRKLNEVHRKR